MKTIYRFIIIFSFLLLNNISYAQLPAYNLGVRNMYYGDTLGGTKNMLFFDIVMQHTNQSISGPFLYGIAQYS
ncbi:MAG: hypothetical protein ABI528_07010, partial [bacterium]